MKKLTVLLFAFAFLAPLSAQALDAPQPFENFYTVANNGETTPVSTFALDGPTPWLYLSLPTDGGTFSGFNFAGTIWEDPNDLSYPLFKTFDGNTAAWLSLPDWGTIQSTGQWTVQGTYLYTNGGFGAGSTSFTVTPEPATMALFGLGAGLLGLQRIRRKKP